MYTVQVIPVSRSTGSDELTYFSAIAYERGAVVSVPVRTKEVPAIVMSCETVKNVKAHVRRSEFALRKLRRQPGHALVTPEFIQAVQNTAHYYATTAGAVLFSYLPRSLLTLDDLPEATVREHHRPRLRGFIIPRLYQDLAHGRQELYRTNVRESFAAGGSVFILVPTVADAERVYAEQRNGIESYTYLLHGSLSRSAQHKMMKEILASEHPVLIVGTVPFLAVPRPDLVSILVEREGSSLYRSRNRPFVDARIFTHEFAAALGGQLFLADLPLRIESVYRKETGEYEEVVSGQHRMHFKTKASLLNMQGVATATKKIFRAVAHDLSEKMRATRENGGRCFLYVARRGLSPVTLCRDCGAVVTCKECDASVVLHRGKEENYFLCHSCGAMRHARERCKACHSWRLEAFGIGTELVERELTTTLPEGSVFVLSADTARTHTQTKRIVEEFYKTPGAVLIGTELALPYLTKHVPLVGVVSLDSLLSLASWNIYERIASTLTRLRELAGEELVVQTRRPEADILQRILGGNFSGFYRSELRARKALGYPPYTVIIKVSVLGTEESVSEQMATAQETLKPYDLVTFSRLIKAPRDKYQLHGFIRVARETWPDDALCERLRSLSPQYTITVDPDSIL